MNLLKKVELILKQLKMFVHLVEINEIFEEYFHYDVLITNENWNIFLWNSILHTIYLKYIFHINEVVHMLLIDMSHFDIKQAEKLPNKHQIHRLTY